MNIFVAILVLFVVLLGIFVVNFYRDGEGYAFSVPMSFLSSASISTVAFIIVTVVGQYFLKLETSQYSYEIVSLKDNSGIQGTYRGSFLYGVYWLDRKLCCNEEA